MTLSSAELAEVAAARADLEHDSITLRLATVAGRPVEVAAGALPVGDMLPETAYVKLMWAMGQTDDYAEVNKLMLTNIAGELTERREL